MDYDVKGNLRHVLADLPEGVRLVAISKYHPNEYIEAAYAEGQRIFGESHEQELRQKVETLPKDIEWHFIGHLQTNKVKYIAPYISMIQAVDSLKLLKEIDKQAAKASYCRRRDEVRPDARCLSSALERRRMASVGACADLRSHDDGIVRRRRVADTFRDDARQELL